MRGSEMGVQEDDTFNDVVRDFSQLALCHPERLIRNNHPPLPQPAPETEWCILWWAEYATRSTKTHATFFIMTTVV